MAIDSRYYIHPADRAALKALKAIPGFNQVMKAFMSVWNEKLFRVENMSTRLKVSEKQLKKYHNMLIAICEKLGIDVPDLFVELNVTPNAYTYGDTNPFIVITSGLLERFPDDLIETVIAHECGHIACHHTLYTTMGSLIMNGAFLLSREAPVITIPLRMAFAYWMRCSEYSADRAAMICDKDSNSIARTCMYLAGFNPDFSDEADINAFIEQANDYIELTKDSKVNKALEFYQFWDIDHPLNAVRAHEAVEWAKTDDYKRIIRYLNKEAGSDAFVPVPDSSKRLIGKAYEEVIKTLKDSGFKNVLAFDIESKDRMKKHGAVIEISIDGKEQFKDDEWFDRDASVSIRYKK